MIYLTNHSSGTQEARRFGEILTSAQMIGPFIPVGASAEFAVRFKSPYILPKRLPVRCFPSLKISTRYIQILGVDFVHHDSRYLQLPVKERSALLYFLERINGTPLDFIQLAIRFISIVFFLKKGIRNSTHSSPVRDGVYPEKTVVRVRLSMSKQRGLENKFLSAIFRCYCVIWIVT